MRRGGWRQHVRAELQRREERSRGLRTLLERHQELRERLEARQPGRPPALQVHLQSEAVGVQREREELRQQVALLADLLRRAEAESREQRARQRRKVMRLREKLARAGEQAGLPCADLDRKGGSFSTSSEEAEPIRANPGQD